MRPGGEGASDARADGARERRYALYVTLAPAFSHATSLFAVSLLVWLWLRARTVEASAEESRGLGRWAVIGVVGALTSRRGRAGRRPW